MRLLHIDNVAEYLRQQRVLADNEAVEAESLSGGVSNAVFLIRRSAGSQPDLIVKQARERLRVSELWQCSVQRILRELAVLRLCGAALEVEPPQPPAAPDRLRCGVPRVVLEDRENYAYAMEAAGETDWRAELLAGRCDANIAAACGWMLGRIHSDTWEDAAVAAQLDDRTFFDQLRLDPYYRHTASRLSDLRRPLEELIESVWGHRCCLVHGDFSPKNLLVDSSAVTLIDFEVGHYGDPAFDLGFFVSHLVLKTLRAAPAVEPYLRLMERFWEEYCAAMGDIDAEVETSIGPRAAGHLAGCMLARLYGKSRVDYLDAAASAAAEQLARRLLCAKVTDWEEAWTIIRRSLSGGREAP